MISSSFMRSTRSRRPRRIRSLLRAHKPGRGDQKVSLKMILSNVSGIAVAGVLFILMSIIGFKGGGKYLPMIGSGIGTWLLILSWDRSRKKRRRASARICNGFLDAQMERLGRKAELSTGHPAEIAWRPGSFRDFSARPTAGRFVVRYCVHNPQRSFKEGKDFCVGL
jgi:hypothetical protein